MFGHHIQGNHGAVGTEELHHLQLALGDGAGLITEQDIQRTGRLDTLGLADQNVVVQHFAGVLHQHQGDHQGQALGHGADDDHNGQGNGFHHVLDDFRHIRGEIGRRSAGLENEVAEVEHGDDNGADIAEAGDHIGQLGQLDFQGRIGLVLLHLLGHLAHHGGKTHLLDVHDAFAVEQHRAAEQGMFVHKGVAGDFIGQLHIRLRRVLGAFLRLAVEGGVVHLQMSGNQDAVRRDFVTGLEQDLVADHHVIHVDDDHNAVPVDFTLVFLGAVFQLAVLGIAGHTGFGRNKGHNQHGHNGTGRFVNIRVAKGTHDDHQRRNGQQNADHGVLEGLLEFRPKGGGFRVRNHVTAVFFS